VRQHRRARRAGRAHTDSVRPVLQSVRTRQRARRGANRRVRGDLRQPPGTAQRVRANHVYCHGRIGKPDDVPDRPRHAPRAAVAVMTSSLLRIVMVATPLLGAALPAAAQPPRRPSVSPMPRLPQPARIDRGYVFAEGGAQLTPTTVADVVNPIDFGEAAIVDSRFRFASAPSFDVGGAYHAWPKRHISIGVQLTQFGRSGTDDVSAQVPHPFFFGRLRSVAGETSLRRTETGVHVQAVWTRPIRPRWQATATIGPSWIHVAQDLVQDVAISQTYPYDTATFASAVSGRRSGTGFGFNVGGAADYALRRRVGLRFSLSASRARVPLD